MSEPREIDWEKLREPIPAEHLETVIKFGGVPLTYVDRNAICERLDRVVRPENWKTDYEVLWEGSSLSNAPCPFVKCTLSIRVEGEWIGISDFGYPNNLERQEHPNRTRIDRQGNVKAIKDGELLVEDLEPAKAAATDAFRRAAWFWGIGWELHEKRQGTPAARAQAAQEGRSAAGDTFPCPVCTQGVLVRRIRKSDGKPFWACNAGTYDRETKTRSGCQHIQNEPPGESPEPTDVDPTENAEPETSSAPPGVDPDKADILLAFYEKFQEVGDQLTAIAKWRKGRGLPLPIGTKGRDAALEEMTAAQIAEMLP